MRFKTGPALGCRGIQRKESNQGCALSFWLGQWDKCSSLLTLKWEILGRNRFSGGVKSKEILDMLNLSIRDPNGDVLKAVGCLEF